eukprot:jgi/Bigna1/73381/fgenesh1_pg.24_\
MQPASLRCIMILLWRTQCMRFCAAHCNSSMGPRATIRAAKAMSHVSNKPNRVGHQDLRSHVIPAASCCRDLMCARLASEFPPKEPPTFMRQNKIIVAGYIWEGKSLSQATLGKGYPCRRQHSGKNPPQGPAPIRLTPLERTSQPKARKRMQQAGQMGVGVRFRTESSIRKSAMILLLITFSILLSCSRRRDVPGLLSQTQQALSPSSKIAVDRDRVMDAMRDLRTVDYSLKSNTIDFKEMQSRNVDSDRAPPDRVRKQPGRSINSVSIGNVSCATDWENVVWGCLISAGTDVDSRLRKFCKPTAVSKSSKWSGSRKHKATKTRQAIKAIRKTLGGNRGRVMDLMRVLARYGSTVDDFEKGFKRHVEKTLPETSPARKRMHEIKNYVKQEWLWWRDKQYISCQRSPSSGSGGGGDGGGEGGGSSAAAGKSKSASSVAREKVKSDKGLKDTNRRVMKKKATKAKIVPKSSRRRGS